MRTMVLVTLPIMLLLEPTSVLAQRQGDVAAARAVADSFFEATAAQRWTDAVALLDLPVFERFFRRSVDVARAQLPQPETTVEELMARDSTLPRAVAEWQLEQSRRSTGRPAFGDFSHQFAGVTSFRMLQSLTPTDAAARWLEAQDPNVRVRRLLSELRCATPTPDSVRLTTLQTYVGRRLRTIGAARTDDTTAFVLVVDSWEPATHDSFYAPPPTALRMRLTPRGWRLVPNGNLYGSRQFISVGCSSR